MAKRLLIVAVAAMAQLAAAQDPVVQLAQGSVRGFVSSNVATYLGVPFAAPPVGPLRFLPPQPVQSAPSNTVLNATTMPSACPQLSINGFNGLTANSTDEDCLYLNIYAPQNAKNLPVLVFIYGGAFSAGYNGTPLYNGTNVLKAATNLTAIIVVPNYRVGPFGFLSSPLFAAKGLSNVGLLDQAAAFKWVRNNIAAFGGDPTRVTAWGESAGAISIATHLVANTSQSGPLFDRYILESGAINEAYSTPSLYYDAFQTLLTNTNCSSVTDIVACLQAIPTKSFLLAAIASNLRYSPVVDGTVIPVQPRIAAANGNILRVPGIIMTDTDEGTFFAAFANITSEEIARGFILYMFPMYSPKALGQIEEVYPFSNYSSPYLQAADVLGDGEFKCPALYLADNNANASNTIYKARFNVKPTITLTPSFADFGVYHGSELVFVWNLDLMLNQTNGETEVAASLISAYMDFAHGQAPGTTRVLNAGNASSNAPWPAYNGSANGGIETLIQNPYVPDQERVPAPLLTKCSVWDANSPITVTTSTPSPSQTSTPNAAYSHKITGSFFSTSMLSLLALVMSFA